MNCATRHALHTTLNRSAVLATAILLPLSWSNQANADIFGALKEATEKFVEKEIEKAVDGDTGEQQSTQALPDMAVLQVQNYLTFLGYYKGSPNGLLDSRTQNAVKSFQRDSGLPDTGLVTPELGAQLVIAFSQFSQTGQIPRNVGASSTPPSPTSPPADKNPAQQTTTTSSAAAGAPATAATSATAATPATPATAPTSATAATPATAATAATPEKTAATSASSGSVADVPNRWTTIENGLVIPHPLKIDGRILSADAE